MSSDSIVEAVGGAVGSMIASAATYPLAIVSTWQALDHSQGLGLVTPELRKKYSRLPSPLQELCIYSEAGGWRALFAGLKPNLAAAAVSQALYFYLYSALRQAVVAHKRAVAARRLSPGMAVAPSSADATSSRTEAIGVVGSLIVAGLAGCGNVLATTPVWVLATQIQALHRHNDPALRDRSAWQLAVQIYEESGIMGFWKGLLPGLVMVANPTLQYIMYEWLTAQYLQLRRRGDAKANGKPRVQRLGAGDVFLLTALAKLGATLVTYPMLLIKSRLQATNSSTAEEARYEGVLHAAAAIWKQEGLGGFFKGMRLKMFQTVLAAALLMSIKEQVYLSTKAVISSLSAARAAAAAAASASG